MSVRARIRILRSIAEGSRVNSIPSESKIQRNDFTIAKTVFELTTDVTLNTVLLRIICSCVDYFIEDPSPACSAAQSRQLLTQEAPFDDVLLQQAAAAAQWTSGVL